VRDYGSSRAFDQASPLALGGPVLRYCRPSLPGNPHKPQFREHSYYAAG
jgi:hypothetical protein